MLTENDIKFINSLEELINKSNNYYNDHNSYSNVIKIIEEKGLTFIGSGQQFVVYKYNNEYVIKIHHPYGEQIDFNSCPRKDFLIERRKYFMFFDYISPNNKIGIHRICDCSKESQKKAYE